MLGDGSSSSKNEKTDYSDGVKGLFEIIIQVIKKVYDKLLD